MIVEIAGAIAAGKTTLLKRLAQLRINPVFEDHEINPFWKSFYSDPGAYAFETEISFLLQHYHFAKLGLTNSAHVVLDHSFELDLAYAQVGLRGSRLRIFQSLYDEIRSELGWPHAVVWIECSPEEELRRIRKRARPVEENVDLMFLQSLNQKLKSRMLELEALERTRILSVDSEQRDFRHDDEWLSELAKELGESFFGLGSV